MTSFWSDRNVFVTGATGLLGSWLTEALLDRGARVIALVRDQVPDSLFASRRLFERAVVVSGALEDFQLLVRVLNEHEVDSIFHLGAQTIVGTAARSALSTFESNIRGTYHVLEAARSSKLVERIVVASSDKAYGIHEQLPYTESARLEGRFPYDVSKSCADLISRSYFFTYELPVAITRCGNLFGPGDLNFNRLIPGTIRSALLGQRPQIRSDGTWVREYFYVEDAVLAYLRLAEHLPSAGVTGEAFNFGTDRPLSVLEVVSAILEATRRSDLEPEILGVAQHEIPRQALDNTKSKSRLGFAARYSFEEAIAKTVPWYRARLPQDAVRRP
ncbi:MAG: GDP-mannose 4,6-dehydratase [Deltaproteobacteria bacterium]|nr:GDP-mannose 4,6-dehydratase [Deltaproteobacteria bacterium]